MSKKTREKQLAKLAARRAAERRRRRRNRAIAIGTATLLVLGAGGAVAWTLLTGEPQRPQAGDDQQDEPTGVACDGKVPQAADERKPRFDKPPRLDLKEGADYSAAIATSCGKVDVDLFEDQTPLTVNNFVFLAEKGFFDGLTFHRVTTESSLRVIQGGDPKGDGTGGPGYQFDDEIVGKLKFDEPGLLAMANSGEDTNGSQFFITLNEPKHLNGIHTIFGEVTDGMDVVREINAIPTDASDAPEQTVYIEGITIHTG
jgi:cyclophilin family peptidyl-prolyl cis-trans isomerase